MRRKYDNFSIFKMATAAILDCRNFKLNGRAAQGRSARCAKFRRNRSNRGGDMAIFRFLKMAAAAILHFSNFKLLNVGRFKRVEMRRHAKFGRNRSKRAEM